MKKISLLTFIILLLAFLAACSDKELIKDSQNATYNHDFAEFNLDVAYTEKNQYEASFEKSVEGLEVSIEDDVNNKKIYGQEAYDQLNPILEKLTFTSTSTNEEVLLDVLNAFGLKDNFVEFELDVLFKDGSKKEYKFIQ